VEQEHTRPPYRGKFGAPRPSAVAALVLPPHAMPARLGARPLKAWRYVGLFAPEGTVCVATVRIGPLRDAFWAVWDREAGELRRGAGPWAGRVRMATGAVRMASRRCAIEIALSEEAGVETVAPAGPAYAWTRKQGGIPAVARIELAGERGGASRRIELTGRAIVDDTAAYYERHTRWEWSAGVGHAEDGRAVAWNLVAGVNDALRDSERTVWIDGEPVEAAPCTFAADLSRVDGLRFHAEAELSRRTHLGLVRSDYRQPIGTFSGELPGGVALADGFGVMERHDAWW
jgi:hypothetical protein